MVILVIDGQGGGLGRELIQAIKREIESVEIVAVGTNSTATEAMLKAGADRAATGDNPVKVISDSVDVIVGPMGIVLSDSMMGEITDKIALSVARSKAKRVLIPVNYCNTFVAGTEDMNLMKGIKSAVEEIKREMLIRR